MKGRSSGSSTYIEYPDDANLEGTACWSKRNASRAGFEDVFAGTYEEWCASLARKTRYHPKAPTHGRHD